MMDNPLDNDELFAKLLVEHFIGKLVAYHCMASGQSPTDNKGGLDQ